MKMEDLVLILAMVAVIALGLDYTARAQGSDPGKDEYQSSCATCHGIDGKGNGPVSPLLRVEPPDLTILAKKNNGIFPFQRVYQVIDGRQAIKPHGPRDMPIWGHRYSQDASSSRAWPFLNPEVLVRGRILAVIDYLNRIQEK